LAKADIFSACSSSRASYDSASHYMSQFFYVDILQSEIEPEHFYTGLTQDLPKRLRAHNSGHIHHSSKWKPWRLKTYIAFSDRSRTAQFERYLKSASSRAFTKGHL
jgi:predicted GIY-YIG superfamily endonuclease